MNDIEKYYNSKDGEGIQMLTAFFLTYENLLSGYRNKDLVLVELGIGNGRCLKMWKEYLGPKAKIYGLDLPHVIDEERISSDEEQIKCLGVDQANKESLGEVAKLLPPIDVLIDDASHMCSDQILTFEELFQYIVPGGIYVCEDIHTSYREQYGGGYQKPGTFIEYCKGIIDVLHHTEDERIPNNKYANVIASICFYPSMAVIRKVNRAS